MEEGAEGVVDDVIDDVAGGVVDAAGFANFGLFFDLGNAFGRQADDLAQELLVDLPEDLDRNFLKDIRAGVVEAFDDLTQDLIVDLQGGGKGIGRAGLAFFFQEMEEPGIVFLIGMLKEFDQVGVDIRLSGDLEELLGRLNFAVFADAQKEEAVDGRLDGIVELTFGSGEVCELFAGTEVAQGDIARQQIAPGFDLLEEFSVHLGGAAFSFGAVGEFVESAAPDGLFGKDFGDLVPMAEVFFKIVEQNAPSGGTVFGVGTVAAVVDGEMLEIGQDGEGKFGVPGVATELIGGFGVGDDPGRRLFRLDEEFPGGADAKGVVGRAGGAFDLEGVFVDDVAVLEGDVALVVDVPTEFDEKGIEEFDAQLGFVVVGGV